jgi:hypothetical protein
MTRQKSTVALLSMLYAFTGGCDDSTPNLNSEPNNAAPTGNAPDVDTSAKIDGSMTNPVELNFAGKRAWTFVVDIETEGDQEKEQGATNEVDTENTEIVVLDTASGFINCSSSMDVESGVWSLEATNDIWLEGDGSTVSMKSENNSLSLWSVDATEVSFRGAIHFGQAVVYGTFNGQVTPTDIHGTVGGHLATLNTDFSLDVMHRILKGTFSLSPTPPGGDPSGDAIRTRVTIEPAPHDVPVAVPTDSETGYGGVAGQFLLDGEIPPPEVFVKQGDATAKDAPVCAAHTIYSEHLVVDPETKGIRHIFVYLPKAPSVHPDLASSAQETVVFDQKHCRFDPHTLFVRTDQSVVIKSGDPITHNTHTNPVRSQPRNFSMTPNDRKGVPLTVLRPDFQPFRVNCDVHPWMRAWWLVLDHPYAGITNEQGRFTIDKLPAGDHKLRVWHEGRYINRKLVVTVEAGQTTILNSIHLRVDQLHP